MRYTLIAVVLLLPLAPAAQEPNGVDVTMPLVEQALVFVRTHAIQPQSEAQLLRAGAIRICGEQLSVPGCNVPGSRPPASSEEGPQAAMAWRQVIESALAAESISKGDAFDRDAFQRYVVDGMIAALDDPQSFFITPAVYRRLTSIPADFTGFGMNVVPERDCLRVTAVHAGSPAADAGLHGGERITVVNGEPVTGYHRPSALATAWGAYDNELEIVFIRGSQPARRIRLTYEPWKFEPFEVSRRKEIAHVRIRTFSAGLAQAVGRQLSGAEGIVLDLRTSTGGQEEEMVALADLLLGAVSVGSKIMRDELGSQAWTAAEGSAGERLDLKVAVITGPGTSGLAEVLAAALRKNDRAILLGRQTAGRSTLETLRSLPDGSAIQLTTTDLRGPNGAALDNGVFPHLKTDRIGVVDLAVKILEQATGPDLDALLTAARNAVNDRD